MLPYSSFPSLPFPSARRPEVAYDRAKLALEKLLNKEVDARRAEAEWEAANREVGINGYGPRTKVPQLIHDFQVSRAAHEANGPAETMRVGLLTFHGTTKSVAKIKRVPSTVGE